MVFVCSGASFQVSVGLAGLVGVFVVAVFSGNTLRDGLRKT